MNLFKTYFVKTPAVIQKVYNRYVWRVINNENKIFLTFDDGPEPQATDFVLDILKKHNVKATFFCVGENIVNNTVIYKRIIDEGHAVGNHTFNHLNGWQTSFKKYSRNIELFEEKTQIKTKLFRPPYGKITNKQAGFLLDKGYKIIMWTILSGDFDKKLPARKCLESIINNVKTGDIIVFHDSKKTAEKINLILEELIIKLKEKKFNFSVLS